MNTTARGTWKPAPRRAPMLSNGRYQMGIPAAIPVFVKWGLPWLLTAGGIAATSLVATKVVPEVPINKRNIGLAAALGGAGLTSYYLSDTLPEGWRSIAYAIAVAGVASSMYFLFKEPETPPVPDILPSRQVLTREQVPQYSPSQMIEAFTVFADPEQPNTGGQRRWTYGDQTYEIIVKNYANQPVTFFTGAAVYDEGSQRLYRSPGPADPKYGRKRTTLAPANQPGNDARILVTVPQQDGLINNVAIDFEFYRQGDDLQPFKTSASIPITYTYLPFF